MEFAHRYAGTSGVTNGDGATAMTLQPDALRPPTYFRGSVMAVAPSPLVTPEVPA